MYDDLTLITRRFRWYATMDLATGRLAFGPRRIRALFRRVLKEMSERTKKHLGQVPILIGEFGIPFDIHNKKAYRTGKYRKQVIALDASFQAIEANLLHGTRWNYTPDNTNAHSDLWNDEDLSIFSCDQKKIPGTLTPAREPHGRLFVLTQFPPQGCHSCSGFAYKEQRLSSSLKGTRT